VRVGGAHHRLHLGGRARIDDGGGRAVGPGQGVLAIAMEGLVRAVDPLGAERALDVLQKSLEIACHDRAPFRPCSSVHQMAPPGSAGGAAAATGAAAMSSVRHSSGGGSATPASAAGSGPPVAQSRSSTVCTTGSALKRAIWVMQPRLPAATPAAPVLSICAALRRPNVSAIAGCKRL